MNKNHLSKIFLLVVIATLLLATVTAFSFREMFGFDEEPEFEGMQEIPTEEGIGDSRYNPEFEVENNEDENREEPEMQMIEEEYYEEEHPEEEYPEERHNEEFENEGSDGEGREGNDNSDLTKAFVNIVPMTMTAQKMGPLIAGAVANAFTYENLHSRSALKVRSISYDGNYKNVLYFFPHKGDCVLHRKDNVWDLDRYMDCEQKDYYDYVEIVFPTFASAIAAKNTIENLQTNSYSWTVGKKEYVHDNFLFWQTTTPCKPDANGKTYCHVNVNKGDIVEISNDDSFVYKQWENK